MSTVSPQVTRIFRMVKELKVSIYAVTKKAGISQSLPYRWRKGDHSPRLDRIESLEQAAIDIARERGTLPEGIEEVGDFR